MEKPKFSKRKYLDRTRRSPKIGKELPSPINKKTKESPISNSKPKSKVKINKKRQNSEKSKKNKLTEPEEKDQGLYIEDIIEFEKTNWEIFDKNPDSKPSEKLRKDLERLTGLELAIENKRIIKIGKKRSSGYSEKARALLSIALKEGVEIIITSKNSIKDKYSTNGEDEGVQFNIHEMEDTISGVFGVDARSVGWGMTFLHELLHKEYILDEVKKAKGTNQIFTTQIKDVYHPLTDKEEIGVVIKALKGGKIPSEIDPHLAAMNEIRKEMEDANPRLKMGQRYFHSSTLELKGEDENTIYDVLDEQSFKVLSKLYQDLAALYSKLKKEKNREEQNVIEKDMEKIKADFIKNPKLSSFVQTINNRRTKKIYYPGKKEYK